MNDRQYPTSIIEKQLNDTLHQKEWIKKSELVEESQKEEYALYVYDLWKNASTLTHRLYSRGEQNPILFVGRKEGIKEDKHA